MNKNLIEGFIKYYYLNGLIEKSIIKTKNDKSFVQAITECNSLATEVTLKDDNIFPNRKIGIFDNKKFLSLLNLFEDDDFNIEFSDRKIKFSGNNNFLKSTFILADVAIINDPNQMLSQLNGVDDWKYSFDLDEDKINLFQKSRNALSDAEKLYINADTLTITNDLNHNNRVDIEINSNSNDKKYNIFNLDHFNTILSILDDNIKCYNHENGLLKLTYSDDNFNCNYYLMAISD